MLAGEDRERQDLGLRIVHERTDLEVPGREVVTDQVPLLAHRAQIRLGEDGPEHRGDHLGLGLGHVGQDVADEVDTAALMP